MILNIEMKKILLLTIILSSLFSQENLSTDELVETFVSKAKKYWSYGYYVDDFYEQTGDKYILSKLIDGTVRNDYGFGEIDVRFFITKYSGLFSNKFSIELIMINSMGMRIKKKPFPNYSVSIKHNGKRVKGRFNGELSGDKFVFNNPATKKINEIFLEGGNVEFLLRNFETDAKYSFSIYNIDSYGYKLITEEYKSN